MLYKNTIESGTLELLKSLQATTLLKDFMLVGGTSLALQIGHRKSIDLDLFIQIDFDTNVILEFLEQKFNFKADYMSLNTLKGSIDNIKIDILSHKYPYVKSPIELENIKLLSVEDISAMKLNAIAGNGSRSKDFIDLYFILKQFKVNEIIEFYKIKYSNRNLLHVLKSLMYFEDVSMDDWPVMVLEKDLTMKKVKETIIKQVLNYQI